jgi:transcriptional regulator with XRE-family HTH domain
MKANATTQSIDSHVGTRIRERRVMLGLTQQQLAELIGVTYQQAHKYERGINRVSAGRLFEIARVLSVPIGFFYEGIAAGPAVAGAPDNNRERMMLELARNFAEIQNERHQEAFSQLARALTAGRASSGQR